MPDITFTLADGSRRTVDAAIGRSVMQAAMDNDVRGMVAECGGNLMCATCHVYVDEAHDLPDVSDIEEEMLECTVSPREENSRLSCQIPVTGTWEHLAVTMPDRQL